MLSRQKLFLLLVHVQGVLQYNALSSTQIHLPHEYGGSSLTRLRPCFVKDAKICSQYNVAASYVPPGGGGGGGVE